MATQANDDKAALAAVVDDFHAEGQALYDLMRDADTALWTQHTTFKDWTIWDVFAHLHFSDYMAMTTLESAEDFKALMASMSDRGMQAVTDEWLAEDGKSPNGPALLERWWQLLEALCATLKAADPQERFTWAGPTMKARMFATARQMETWAHGWELYDLLDLPRPQSDRLLNIATIGVRTFGWTFTNRGLEVPSHPPHVRLTAPSSAIWEWHAPESGEATDTITGDAVDFCQVVTQTRNIADTSLEVRGDVAAAWMAIAQCFAGPPEDPPAPGSRAPVRT